VFITFLKFTSLAPYGVREGARKVGKKNKTIKKEQQSGGAAPTKKKEK
jgi:hypothetical protein